MFAVAALFVTRNRPPTLLGNQQIEAVLWCLPLAGVLLSFVPLAWAQGNQWAWLLRIALVGVVGVCALTTYLCGAIDYSDSRNSGVGAGWMMFIGLGLMTLFCGLAIASVFIFTKWRFAPFAKWVLVMAGVLAVLWAVINWLAAQGK